MSSRAKVVAVVIGLAIVLLALVVLGYFALHDYQVLNKGQILPYTRGYIYEIQVFGKYSIFVEPEVYLSSDVFNAAIMLGVAYISLTFGTLLYRRERPRVSKELVFFATLSFAMFYLSADELFGIHESLGHNLRYLAKIPGVSRPDDFIIALYGVGALIYLFVFRGVFLSARRSFRYFGAALAMFIVAALLDLAALRFEEVIEVIASVLFLAGVLSLGYQVMEPEKK